MSLVIDNLLECITIEVCFKNQKRTVISCVYRTPNSDLDIFNEKINDILSKARGNKDIYICGDFNIDLLKHESNNGTNNFLNILYSLGLYPLIVKPTRITTHSYTLIDNIFTNNLCNENESGILINDISDHLPIFSMIRNKSVNTTKDTKYKIVRNNSETNIIAFKRALDDQNWDCVENESDVNIAYDNFSEIFGKLYNEYCPVKRIKLKNDSKPWFTNGLRNACKKKKSV